MIDDVCVTVQTSIIPFTGTSATSHESENMTSDIIHAADIGENEPTLNEGERVQSNEERRLKRKQSLEAQVTTGCGGGRKKQRILDAFYETLWPMLEDLGWKIVSARKTSELSSLIKSLKRLVFSIPSPKGLFLLSSPFEFNVHC